jgi:hypothetical protein
MPTLAGMDRILQPAGQQTGDQPAERALSPQSAGPAVGGFGNLMPFQAVPGMIPVPVPVPAQVPANLDPQVLAWLLRQSQAGPNPQVSWMLNRLTAGV